MNTKNLIVAAKMWIANRIIDRHSPRSLAGNPWVPCQRPQGMTTERAHSGAPLHLLLSLIVLSIALPLRASGPGTTTGELLKIPVGARAIGMTRNQSLRRIVLPQAVKRMIPAFMERAIELMKTTTLVATIAYADLLYAANEIAQKTFRPLETFTVAALIYFVVITAFSLLARRLERRLAVSGESTVH